MPPLSTCTPADRDGAPVGVGVSVGWALGGAAVGRGVLVDLGGPLLGVGARLVPLGVGVDGAGDCGVLVALGGSPVVGGVLGAVGSSVGSVGGLSGPVSPVRFGPVPSVRFTGAATAAQPGPTATPVARPRARAQASNGRTRRRSARRWADRPGGRAIGPPYWWVVVLPWWSEVAWGH
ncbi:hypothetical protein QQG74_03610 [Micromonospora sp. FIMYZ51]|uniref:hypothetical protein n=1 Tax=Micromonospora sp. FIMYZ51 TaxID=3051832 RepID=UPI00311FA9AB